MKFTSPSTLLLNTLTVYNHLVYSPLPSPPLPSPPPLLLRPVPSKDAMRFICEVSGDDHSAVALTQEILVYLSMFIRSEPELFTEMLRLRIGLIQNVMVSELSRAMDCSCECHMTCNMALTGCVLRVP